MWGHTTSIEFGRSDKLQWGAVGCIKYNSVLCIDNVFVGFFSYGIKETPCCSKTAGSSVIEWVNYPG